MYIAPQPPCPRRPAEQSDAGSALMLNPVSWLTQPSPFALAASASPALPNEVPLSGLSAANASIAETLDWLCARLDRREPARAVLPDGSGIALAVRHCPNDFRRLEVKPGLTCLWQIGGRADLPFDKQTELDIEYPQRRSIAQDILILLRTIPAVLTARGAY